MCERTGQSWTGTTYGAGSALATPRSERDGSEQIRWLINVNDCLCAAHLSVSVPQTAALHGKSAATVQHELNTASLRENGTER